ncbi:hypothetical protein K440DRAFT_623105 [Wilcoxina mikolae CBS 423.85]|nr:hypothetical protein K440DRAFT_623105 [Wilcoxina mikolae CBS 423.85]
MSVVPPAGIFLEELIKPTKNSHQFKHRRSGTVYPSCRFGPLNPGIDAACPNCGHIRNYSTPGQDGAEIVGKVEKLMPLQGEHGFAE